MGGDKNNMCEATENYDYIIVGAGPAGLQMAYFLQNSGRRYVVFEAAKTAASFFVNNPRSGRLISLNKKYNMFKEEEFNMRHDWNSLLSDDPTLKFTEYSDDLYPQSKDFHKYMNDYAQRLRLNIEYGTKVVKIGKRGSEFSVKTWKVDSTTEGVSTCTARCVLMATGAVSENIPKGIEGRELAESYTTMKMDKEKYRNKIVMVVGCGNSAFETADYLADSAGIVHVTFRNEVKFAWNSHYLGDLRAVNNNILDMYQLKSLHAAYATERIEKISKAEDGRLSLSVFGLNAEAEEPHWFNYKLPAEHVIFCTGWKYADTDIFNDSINIDLISEDRYPNLSSCWETNTKNLFFIGAPMAAIDKQSASGFVHGFRYNIRTLNNLLENRFFGKELPHELLPSRDLDALTHKILERVTIAASLHQMSAFLCDVITFDEEGRTKYYIDLPKEHVMERPEFQSAKDLFIIVLDYGFNHFGVHYKPENHVRPADFNNNGCAALLHPVIEHYSYGEYVDQTELQESLIGRFDEAACEDFLQWPSSVNENYVKWYINEKMCWSDERFDLIPFSKDILGKSFVPLTEEEKRRIPELLEKSECAPAQDLLPKHMSKTRERILRPTMEEMLASA